MLYFLIKLTTCLGKITPASYFSHPNRPLIISHRGASGHIPEHTLQAYEIASYMGADFIEPDLCPSKDGYLVVGHEGLLNQTTNVESIPELAYLHTTKTFPRFNGVVTETGWFIEDFTLAQIKLLRVKQRFSFRPQTLDYYFEKITINEALDFAISANEKRKKNGKPLLGVYIELKNPAYYNSIGYYVEDILLQVLKERGIDNVEGASAKCPIVLQCFELESLLYMSKKTDLPTVFLMSRSNSVFYRVHHYAELVNGVCAGASLVFNPDGTLTSFVKEAHQYGLKFHMGVVKDDIPMLPLTQQQIYQIILRSQIDGVFHEFPDSASIYFNLKGGTEKLNNFTCFK